MDGSYCWIWTGVPRFASIFIGMKGIAWLLNPVKVVKGISNAIKALIKFASKRGLPNLNPFKRKRLSKAAGGIVTGASITMAPMVMMPQMAKRWMD